MPPLENETPEDETPEGAAPAEETSLLDSINEALAPTLPAEIDETPADDAEDEELEDESEDGDETEADEDGTTVDANGRKHGPDGKLLPADKQPKAADGTGKDGKPGESKVGPDGKPLVEPKKADPVNDPIPDEVKGRTRERMQSLITAVKQKDEHIAVQNQLVDSISSTGATAEEFGAMLGYMRWVHSDKPEDLKQARELLLSELEGISLKLGEPAPGVDFLSKFPDLQAKVDNGQIDIETANELALNRQRGVVETTRKTQQQTTEQAQQAATAERNGAIAELNTLGATLSSTDPEYATKHEILQPILQSLGQLPPKQWKAAFTNAYKAITPAQVERYKATGVAPVAAKPGQKAAGNQPLRANKVPTGGQQKAATSLFDAVSAAVDAAG